MVVAEDGGCRQCINTDRARTRTLHTFSISPPFVDTSSDIVRARPRVGGAPTFEPWKSPGQSQHMNDRTTLQAESAQGSQGASLRWLGASQRL